MLRNAVNLSPDSKPSAPAHSQAAASPPADGFDSDAEEQAPQPSAWARQSSSQQCVAGLGNCRASQQGQEGDRGAVVLREAYRGMLLQQQAKHRAELDKRQAKYQRQLDAQVWLCMQALHVIESTLALCSKAAWQTCLLTACKINSICNLGHTT